MDQEPGVILRIFDSVIDAELARSHLEANGITAIIHKTDIGGMRPIMVARHGVQLIVLAGDKDAAEEILKAMGV